MKNLRFILGMFLGILIGIFVFKIVSCKSEPPAVLPQTLTKIDQVDNFYCEAYKLNVDNTQYIVVVNTRQGGIAIVKDH